MKCKLYLIRHGQSTYNLENRFTGWKDVDLTKLARKILRDGDMSPEVLRSEGEIEEMKFTTETQRAQRNQFQNSVISVPLW